MININFKDAESIDGPEMAELSGIAYQKIKEFKSQGMTRSKAEAETEIWLLKQGVPRDWVMAAIPETQGMM